MRLLTQPLALAHFVLLLHNLMQNAGLVLLLLVDLISHVLQVLSVGEEQRARLLAVSSILLNLLLGNYLLIHFTAAALIPWSRHVLLGNSSRLDHHVNDVVCR